MESNHEWHYGRDKIHENKGNDACVSILWVSCWIPKAGRHFEANLTYLSCVQVLLKSRVWSFFFSFFYPSWPWWISLSWSFLQLFKPFSHFQFVFTHDRERGVLPRGIPQIASERNQPFNLNLRRTNWQTRWSWILAKCDQWAMHHCWSKSQPTLLLHRMNKKTQFSRFRHINQMWNNWL